MTLEDLNAKLAAILPGFRFAKGYLDHLWLRGPGTNQSVRLDKAGKLIRAGNARSTITVDQCEKVGALVKEYRRG